MKKNKVAATAAKIKATFQYFDYRIFIVYLLLMTIGVIAVYSASSEILLIHGFKATVYGQKQLLYAFFGVLICLACYSINLDYLRRGKLLLWLLAIVAGLLVYVRLFGQAVNGAKGWINLGPINIQPLELAKLVLTLYLARMLAKADGRLVRGHIISQLLPTAIIAGLLMILVLIEPDFGGTAILFCLVLIMYSVSGIPDRLHPLEYHRHHRSGGRGLQLDRGLEPELLAGCLRLQAFYCLPAPI